MIEKGTWVKIHNIVLTPEQRAPQVPDDTKKVPLEMWVKGHLMEDSEVGKIAKIKTRTNRIISGEIVEVNPTFTHSFGNFIPELLEIDDQTREIVFGGDDNE